MSQDDRDRRPDNDRLDALLRRRNDPLGPPPGTWESIRRRARRRRYAKLAVAVTAGVVIVAGAVPAVIAVRHNQSGSQTLRVTASTLRTTSSQPAIPAPQPTSNPLRGFIPQSVSFVSPAAGFLLGASSPDAKSPATVARTDDGGQTWTQLSAPPIDARGAGIRFADGVNGYVFGHRFYVTTDGGHTWTQQTSPGYIDDLETMQGRVWALVSSCDGCTTARLFGATVADPTLRHVAGVPKLTGDELTLALAQTAVFVLAQDRGSSLGQLWSSQDGANWTQGVDPCDGNARGRIATWNPTGLVAECAGAPDGQGLTQILTSTDSGMHWTTRGQLTTTNPGPISAGNAKTFVVSPGSRGKAMVSVDGGHSWTPVKPGASSLGFIGFISPSHIVGLPATATGHAFLTSYNAGQLWQVTRFPK